ncbi:MAG TPA: DUF4244 domain-containing protein [Acidimicrobiales bacterium]|nr:DUF4244 domain-containing protein [Acidimicrobiales bacterium]
MRTYFIELFLSLRRLALYCLALGNRVLAPPQWRHRAGGDRGQTTAEYALVLLAAATLALLLVAWAAQSGKIGTLFDTVFDHVIDKVA